FKQLAAADKAPTWNFQKYLVGRDGKLIRSFTPRTQPNDPELVKAIQAAMIYLVGHSLFKGALFMAAGCIDHETGTREVTRLSGLRGAMPITALAAGLAALSMAGLPPFFGFIAKEFAYKATLGGLWAPAVTSVAVAGSAILFAVALLVGVKPFFGARGDTPKPPHEGTPSLWLGPLVLAVAGLAFGPFNGIAETALVGPAAVAVAGAPIKVDLYLWGGFELALALSIVTIALGIALFLGSGRARAAIAAVVDKAWGPDAGYDQAMDGLAAFARWITGRLQTGLLRRYLLITFLFVAAAVSTPTLLMSDWVGAVRFAEANFYVWGVAVMTVAGALAIAITRSRLVAILSTGVLGLAVALVFLLFGAPDLAFTQLMVETLSVVILALIISRLPVFGSDWRGSSRALRDAGIALFIGFFVTALLLSISARPLDLALSEYFSAKSYTEAYGRNIVNVILVDFRALDTLGEIAVVVIAAVAVLALISPQLRARKGDKSPETSQ
ncbi:MAG: hydrogen gas-evolving membrane-bound hydrogenase subunit E, partial [Pseudomonadota bacterium]